MNTQSPKSTDSILQADNRGEARYSVSCRGSMMRNFKGLVYEYSSYRLVYDKNDISPSQHIPDLCVSSPISVLAKVTLMVGLQD